jgi:fido (protein-threonine AMPylation protein)
VPGELRSFEEFSDHPDSPFYCAAGRTPTETWNEITGQMKVVLAETAARNQQGHIEITLDSVRAWHGAIFQSTFPDDAGRLRWQVERGAWEHVSFGIAFGTVLTRLIKLIQGTHPRNIQKRVSAACAEFDRASEDLTKSDARTVRDATFPAARLYAKLLTIHPFVDGNLRVAYVALQAALLNLDLVMVEFHDRGAHNEAISAALRTDSRQSYKQLADLIAEIIKKGV